MTPKERWLAALALEPVDRLPFWPKLTKAYSRAQEPPFREMRVTELHDWMESDDHVGVSQGLKEIRTDTAIEKTGNAEEIRTVYRGRHGTAEMIEHFDLASQSWHPVRHPVQSVDDIQVIKDCYEDCRLEIDEEELSKGRAQSERVGQRALTKVSAGKSALMMWVEYLAGIENAHILLIEHEDEVVGLFEAMHRVLVRATELLCECTPADVMYLTENTSTTLTSPGQYRRYCYDHILECAKLAEQAGRSMILHMCGHLKALLPDLATIPVAGFEAFTSPPLGNTTLLDGRTACPNTCLVGGTNAVLWTRPADAIIAEIERDLDVLPHHRGLVVTSAGVMPPLAAPETIKAVGDWVKAHPVKL